MMYYNVFMLGSYDIHIHLLHLGNLKQNRSAVVQEYSCCSCSGILLSHTLFEVA